MGRGAAVRKIGPATRQVGSLRYRGRMISAMSLRETRRWLRPDTHRMLIRIALITAAKKGKIDLRSFKVPS